MRFPFIISGLALCLMIGGCTNSPGNLMPADNITEFSTRGAYDGHTIPQDVLKRAAYTTLRRGYSHFTISANEPNSNNSGWRPSLGISYGRDPNGFGDPGFGNNGLGVGASVTRPISSPHINWRVVMYKTNDARSDIGASSNNKLYDAKALTQ